LFYELSRARVIKSQYKDPADEVVANGGDIVLYKKIMVPVDLIHVDKLEKALSVAADLSRHYSATVCYVGVTAKTPSPIAHTPEEYAKKLMAFAAAQGEAEAIETTSKALPLDDPAVEINRALVHAVDETGSDLVVMASHIPNVANHFWPSHGGQVASHSGASVLLVR
jgi:nucleotide-binding universal stress UspA family protein